MRSNVGAAPKPTPGLRSPARTRTLASHPVRHRLVIPAPSVVPPAPAGDHLPCRRNPYQTLHNRRNPRLQHPEAQIVPDATVSPASEFRIRPPAGVRLLEHRVALRVEGVAERW